MISIPVRPCTRLNGVALGFGAEVLMIGRDSKGVVEVPPEADGKVASAFGRVWNTSGGRHDGAWSARGRRLQPWTCDQKGDGGRTSHNGGTPA